MVKAGVRPRPEWEQLPDSGQRIYLALAEGDLERARQLYQRDQRPRPKPRRRRASGGVTAPTGPKTPAATKARKAPKAPTATTAPTATKAPTAPKPPKTPTAPKARKATVAARRPARDLRGFVARGDRLEPPEMAAAEAWKRRQVRRGSESV
jgi:hypothetical protein